MTFKIPRTSRRLLLGGVAIGLAGSLVTLPVAMASAPTRTISAVDGVWTDGYGSVVAIANGVATRYEATSISCLPGSVARQVGPVGGDGTVRFASGPRSFSVRARHSHGVLHQDGSVGDVHLHKLSRLPEACTRPAQAGPLASFDVFWTTYAESYPFFAAKGIDWTAVRDQYRPRVRPDTTDDELFDIFVHMIQPLGDAHTGVESAIADSSATDPERRSRARSWRPRSVRSSNAETCMAVGSRRTETA